MLQKNRYKISNQIGLCILQRLCYCYYYPGLFLVMCHHATYNHLYYYPEPDCCTGTVNISSWCVCMCAHVWGGGGGGGVTLLMHWLGTSDPSPDISNKRCMEDPHRCLAPLANVWQPHCKLWSHHAQVQHLWFQTDTCIYVYTEWRKGSGGNCCTIYSHGKVMYP